ncbi:MAG: metal-sensing transcriptional repressor [Lachnospiraceae bacterium]|nr:metal-sensing transcriptional repressor [Candidatus Equihabitans merdae]
MSVHTHVDAEGHVYSHDHEDSTHLHNHGHVHTNTKQVLNRLSRAIGHLESVRRMVEDGRDCADVVIQLAAVKSAINNVTKLILTDHIEHCLVDAVNSGDEESLKKLEEAINKFVK